MAVNANNLLPPNNFKFDCAQVKKKVTLVTAFGTPWQYANILEEEDFFSYSESDGTGLTSDEDVLPDSPITSNQTQTASSAIKEEKIKEERSDSESPRGLKSTSKYRKKKSHKSRRWTGVDYSESEDSEDDGRNPRFKKRQDYWDDDREGRRIERSDDSEAEYYADNQREENYRHNIKKEEPDYELKYNPDVTAAFGNFHCKVCNIDVNSELVYQTHIQGKRHQKALKARNIPEIAIKSVTEGGPLLIPPLYTRKLKRILLDETSYVQDVASNHTKDPIPGLSEIVEIRPVHNELSDVTYECTMCEAKCVPNSIMPHLIGYKHYLRFLEKIEPNTYERYKNMLKRHVEDSLRRILFRHEKRYGRGRIRVEQEIDDESPLGYKSEIGRRIEPEPNKRDEPEPKRIEPRPSRIEPRPNRIESRHSRIESRPSRIESRPSRIEPGPSTRNEPKPSTRNESRPSTRNEPLSSTRDEPGPSTRNEPGPRWKDDNFVHPLLRNFDVPGDYDVSGTDCLDISMNDFYCKVCDSHMNKRDMWENHVKGKRHLKNIKKMPGETSSKIKAIECPNAAPHLLKLMEEEPDVYVGLDFIKETQNVNGDQYNCFLCGACTSSYDIRQHLTAFKHRLKYLEVMNEMGKHNAVEEVKNFYDFTAEGKEALILDVCKESLDKYGHGKVRVYRSKDIMQKSYKSRY